MITNSIYNYIIFYDIGTKFLLPLAMNNFRWGNYETHKVSSPIPTEFFPYAWVKNQTTCLKGPKLLPPRPIHCWLTTIFLIGRKRNLSNMIIWYRWKIIAFFLQWKIIALKCLHCVILCRVNVKLFRRKYHSLCGSCWTKVFLQFYNDTQNPNTQPIYTSRQTVMSA
jgi:hypothetical protein